MASGQTDRLNLPQWLLGTDAFLRSEMNSAFIAIDELVALADQGAGAPGSAAEMERGFYFDTTAQTLYYSRGATGGWVAIATLSSDTPNALSIGGSGSVGTSDRAARSDHTHAMPAFGSVGNVALTSSNGSATTVARSDHVHGVPDNTITPAKLTSAIAGSGLTYNSTTGVAVNPGATTAVASNALIVKAGSLTQTQPSTGYRFTRTGDPSTDVAQGDLSTNSSNELKVRNGSSAWQKPANLPWGILAVVNLDNISSGLTTGDISGLSATVTVGTGRMIRLRCVTPGVATASSDSVVSLQIKEGSSKYQQSDVYCTPLKTQPLSVETAFSPSAGSHTYKIAIETGTPVTIQTGGSGSFKSTVFMIEDIGPTV